MMTTTGDLLAAALSSHKREMEAMFVSGWRTALRIAISRQNEINPSFSTSLVSVHALERLLEDGPPNEAVWL